MPEPVSTIAIVATTSALLSPLSRHNLAVSESGMYMGTQASQWEDYASSPISQDRSRYEALKDLQALIEEHNYVGWDGMRAPAISSEAIQTTRDFLKCLPDDIADPEFAVEADSGAISLEWYGGYRKIASVSINKTKRLAFASLNGTDSTSAVYSFPEMELSPALLASIRLIVA